MSDNGRKEQQAAGGGAGRLAWFFVGVAAGVAVAVLYAPRSGREVRGTISGTSKDLYGRSCDIYEKGRQLVDDAADLFERGRKLARGAGDWLMAYVTLGDFRVTLVRDSAYWWDGGAMFGVVPKTLWSQPHRSPTKSTAFRWPSTVT